VHADPANANPSQSNRRLCPGAFLIQNQRESDSDDTERHVQIENPAPRGYVVMNPPTGGPMTGAANPGHVM